MSKSLIARLHAAFGGSGQNSLIGPEQGLGTSYKIPLRGLNSDGTEVYDLIGTGDQNKVYLNGAYHRGLLTPVVVQISAAAKIATMPLFVNNDTDTLELAAIDEIHSVANGATLTAYVSHEPATSGAPGSGATVMSGTFNMNGTANTLQSATMAGYRGTRSLRILPGDQLSLKFSTTLTSLAGLCIVLWFRPFNGPPPATLSLMANGDIADMTMFLNAIAGKKIRKVAMRWSTAGTNSGTVTADVKKDTGTTAPAGGTSVLLAAQSVKGTANYTVFPSLAASSATLTLAQTDRLSLDVAGTLTALAGLVISVFFEPQTERFLEIPVGFWDGQSTDRVSFIADRWYRFIGMYATWSTASAGGTSQASRDIGTDAPGAGTDLLGTAIDNSATANTPLPGVPITTNPFTLVLKPGDRLAIDQGGTLTSLAGYFAVIVLEKM